MSAEIPYKEWALREGARFGMTRTQFYEAVSTGVVKLPRVGIRRGPAGRAIAVDPSAVSQCLLSPKDPREIPIRKWIESQAKALGITVQACWMRFYRNQLPRVSIVRRKADGRVVSVLP